jgi:haloalkane dehalogenase
VLFRGLNFPVNFMHSVQGDPESIDETAIRAYHYALSSWGYRAAPLALARMVPNKPNHPSVPQLEAGGKWAASFEGPVRLVWGMEDPILGRALYSMKKIFPHAPATETNAGHFLQEEVPDILADAIIAVREEAGTERAAPVQPESDHAHEHADV